MNPPFPCNLVKWTTPKRLMTWSPIFRLVYRGEVHVRSSARRLCCHCFLMPEIPQVWTPVVLLVSPNSIGDLQFGLLWRRKNRKICPPPGVLSLLLVYLKTLWPDGVLEVTGWCILGVGVINRSYFYAHWYMTVFSYLWSADSLGANQTT